MVERHCDIQQFEKSTRYRTEVRAESLLLCSKVKSIAIEAMEEKQIASSHTHW